MFRVKLPSKTIIFCLMIFFTGTAFAESFEDKNYDFGISSGIWLPGKIAASDDLSDSDFSKTLDKKATFFLRCIADAYVVPKLALGGYINYSNVALEKDVILGYWDGEDHEIPKSGIIMLEFGGTIKARFIVNHKLAIKPGFNIGYRQTFSENEDARCKGLGLNGSCEIQYRTPMDLIVYGDIGFLTQPVGGVQDVAYMLFSPIFYIALGIGL